MDTIEEIADLKREILTGTTKESVEAEFKRTANPWYACLLGHLDAVETLAVILKKRNYLRGDEYQKIDGEIEALKVEYHAFKKSYPEKDSIIPEGLLDSLIAKMVAICKKLE